MNKNTKNTDKKTDFLEKISPNLGEVNDKIKKHIGRFSTEDGRLKEEFLESVSCYNCGFDSFSSEFYVEGFRHIRCAKCGMVYVNPRLKSNIIESTYGEEDYSTFQYRTKILPAIDFRRNVLGVRKYNQIQKYFEKPGKVLDVGCGAGEVLSIFKEKGWDCRGIEFNEFAADYAREKFGLDILQKSIYDFDTENQYDCVMMWGVLEHFIEPKKLLAKVKSLLAPGGLLLIEVPSADSFLVRFMENKGKDNKLSPKRILIPDGHIMLFSHVSLNDMLESCGLKIEKFVTNGLDVNTLFRLLSIPIKEDDVVALQEAVDASSCGDLIRAFCRHKER